MTPSPRNATSAPDRRCRRTRRALCSGLTRANTVVVGIAAASPVSSRASMSVPVSTLLAGRPRSWQTLAATAGLSPVTILTAMPRPARRARAAAASAFGGSRNTSSPTSRRSRSSAGVSLVRSAAGRVATATTRLPAVNSAARAAVAVAGTSKQRCSTASGAPLVTIVWVPFSSRTRTDTRRRSWSNGSTDSRTSPASRACGRCAAGDSHNATSSGLPPTARPFSTVASEHVRPQRNGASGAVGSMLTARMKLIRP